MRPCDSNYDRNCGNSVQDLLTALIESGRVVETYTNGNVSVDGCVIESDDFEREAMQWSGDNDDVDEMFKSTLTAKRLHDAWCVEDSKGGIWWPDEDAAEEIGTAIAPAETAIHIATQTPMRGTWHN